METASIFSVDFSYPSFFVALAVTALCFVFAPIAVRLKSKSDERGGSSLKKACNCVCSCSDTLATATAESYLNGGSEGGGGEVLEMAPAVLEMAPAVLEMVPAVGERLTGASMMEQLVPEITTHALSYLDYPSLCRLSMTNSSMRKAANDDNAWKALYHKDFTLEQDNIRPVNGWKAYYAATRAIVNVNAGFFNIIRERSLPAMGRLWLNADYVKCIHATGELFTSYNAVMESWQLAFNWEQGVNFQVRDVRARVMTDMAWVSMKTSVDMGAGLNAGPFNMTNVFEFHNGRWYMVHHHSSVMLVDGEGQQQIVQG